MRTREAWLAVAALAFLPSCQLLFPPEQYWRDTGAPEPDAFAADAFAEPDVFEVPDANLDAFVAPDAFMRPTPTPPGPQRTIALNCSAAVPSIVYADPVEATVEVARLEQSLASFPGWTSFAMLANTLQIGGDEPVNTIPSHAIWMDASRNPRVTWLEPSAPGLFEVGWDLDEVAGNRVYMSTGIVSAFVRASRGRFVAGGGETLFDCPNVQNPTGCTMWNPAVGAKWGGLASRDRVIRARQSSTMVTFPESTPGSPSYANRELLRQVTGEQGGLYSTTMLYQIDDSAPYRVIAVPLTSGNPRVSHDGIQYVQANIDTSFTVSVSDCTTESCGPAESTIISLPGEALVDWTFHALSEGARVVVLLTRDDAAPITRGTHVSVAVWHAGDATAIPLRIASGRFPVFSGEGRSIESVAELSGAQLDVYVSTLVNFEDGATPHDRIYLSGFRLCL